MRLNENSEMTWVCGIIIQLSGTNFNICEDYLTTCSIFRGPYTTTMDSIS